MKEALVNTLRPMVEARLLELRAEEEALVEFLNNEGPRKRKGAAEETATSHDAPVRKRKMSAKARKAISRAQKARWAAQRGEK
jgi:hypothetical protein